MKPRLFCLWLLLSAAVGLFAYDFQYGDLYYNITSDSTVEVTYQIKLSFQNYAGLLSANIPASIEYVGKNYSVTSIGEYAFCGCRSLTSITISNSVTSTGEYAFYGCSGLTSITIGNSVTSIGGSVFLGCSGLTSITIGSSVTDIAYNAFDDCSGLTSVIWNAKRYPDCYRESIFKVQKSQITSFVFGDSVQHIPAYLCNGMNNLASVTIGNSVTSIGNYVFQGCSSMTSVIWNAKKYLDCDVNSTPFYLFDVGYLKVVYDLRPQITSFVFGDSVQNIPTYLCKGMANLQSVTIGNSVTSIEDGAFEGCSSITSVIWNAKNYPDCKESIFKAQISKITSFVLGDNVQHVPAYLCNGMNNLSSVAIGNSVTSIGSSTFSGCSRLTSITIPNSVTRIGGGAFKGCSRLTSITIPNRVTSIGSSTFSGCSRLTSITIPNSVTSIGSSAFSGCSGLTAVTIPNSVTSIGSKAFEGCKNIEIVELGENIHDIGEEAFAGCQHIYEMRVAATVVPNVEENTFSGVSPKITIYVPAESVKKYQVHPVWGLFNISALSATITLYCDKEQGTVIGGGSYSINEEITIAAIPNAGYNFVQWSDGNKESMRTITVTGDAAYTAYFEPITAIDDASITPHDSVRKVVRDGQVLIIRGDKTYTATGIEVE